MATARKAWFKCADSVHEEPWTNDQLAFMVRLQGLMHTRWARNGLSAEEASTITLTRSQLEAISGKRRSDVARTSAERLANVLSISVEHRGDVTVIHWPKWAEYQGLPSECRESPLREKPLPRTETETRPETDIRAGAKAPTPARKPAAKDRKIPLPDPIPAELHDALTAPLSKAGVDPTAFWAAARSWADRNGKRYAGLKGWSLALQSAVRESWQWVPKPGGARASPPNHAERVAERTKEAARNVLLQSREKSRGRDGEGTEARGPDGDVPRLRAAGD